jgi:pyruvate formate lyase activating enzyme
VAGRRVTAEEIVAEVLKDAPFFATSGGGVTLGGGEPLAQGDFACAVLRQCRFQGIHTAIETCGHVPWPAFETILPFADLFLYDVKHLDASVHRAQTGGDVAVILANLERLAVSGARVIVRVPVVPGFNDAREDVRAIADRVARLGIRELHLLPHHRLGDSKYRLLGRPVGFRTDERVLGAHLATLTQVAQGAGLIVRTGG